MERIIANDKNVTENLHIVFINLVSFRMQTSYQLHNGQLHGSNVLYFF